MYQMQYGTFALYDDAKKMRKSLTDHKLGAKLQFDGTFFRVVSNYTYHNVGALLDICKHVRKKCDASQYACVVGIPDEK